MTDKIEIVRTTRRVIEAKLLAAVDDKDKVAILTDKKDLEILVAALLGYDWDHPPCPYANFTQERKRLGADLQLLLQSAFP